MSFIPGGHMSTVVSILDTRPRITNNKLSFNKSNLHWIYTSHRDNHWKKIRIAKSVPKVRSDSLKFDMRHLNKFPRHGRKVRFIPRIYMRWLGVFQAAENFNAIRLVVVATSEVMDM